MIGLAGLALTPSLNTRSIGVGGAIVLATRVAMALTLLPALLAILGPRIDAPAPFRRWVRTLDADRRWAGWAAWVTRHARALAAAGLLLLVLASAPMLGLRTDFAASSLLPRYDLEFQHGLDALQALGRKNAYAPVDLLVTAEAGAILEGANLEALLALSRRLEADPRVLEVLGPVDLRPGLGDDAYRRLYRHWRTARALAPDRFDAFVSRDGRRALVQVVARDALRFEAIQALARDLAAQPPPPGVRVLVGGQAALYNDTHAAVVASAPGMVAFVVGATFLLLALLYRSVLVPLKATLLNLLSVGAGCGALVVLFQWGFGAGLLGLQEPTGGLPPAILATIFGIVFGLSMDYEVFLLSRIKEIHDETGDNALATERGLAATGGVITAAALVMATVFTGFAGMELVMVQMLGVGLAVAVLVDATIVRVMVAPALMRLAGSWNWWPGTRRRAGAGAGMYETGPPTTEERIPR
jgi:RND superfamily putative drug exporter